MKTSNMRDKEIVTKQYKDSLNLDIRKSFHKKYGTNPIEYPDWILSNIKFFRRCHVLEIGCGTGSLWENHLALVDTFDELILTDISKGMLDIARGIMVGEKI